MNPITQLLHDPYVEVVGWMLVHFLWQGALVMAIAAAILVQLRRASANARYVAASGSLAVMATCPIMTLALLLQSMPPAPLRERNELIAPVVLTNDLAVGESRVTGGLPDPGDAVTPSVSNHGLPSNFPSRSVSQPVYSTAWPRTDRLVSWIAFGWVSGVLVLSLRLLVGWVKVQRIRHVGTRPAGECLTESMRRMARALSLSRPIQLLLSTVVEVPTLIGWLRPVILVPASAIAGLEPAQLEGLLAHELSHIRRHDFLVNLVQTVLETLLFYHPAVWWVSNRMRQEREHCCDDLAIEICGNRATYVRALATMERLRGERPQLAIAARGGSLLGRIQRILRNSAPDALPATSWFAMIAIAAAIVTIPLAVRLSAFAKHTGDDAQQHSAEPSPDFADGLATDADSSDEPQAGAAEKALQCRLIAVAPAADADNPDLTPQTTPYADFDQVTFAVELKNVSNMEVQLLGVRYGESFAPPTPGKLNAEGFGPYLVEFEFTDSAGKPIERPARAFLEKMMMMSGMSVHAVAPSKSLVIFLRPARFSHGMEYHLPPGEYRARVRYRGPTPEVLGEIKKHWPGKPQVSAWSGEVVSADVPFSIAGDAAAGRRPALVWGEPIDGLRAALELVPSRVGRKPLVKGLGDQPVPHGTKLDLRLHVQNVTDHLVQVVSETWRQEDQITVRDEAGDERKLEATWYSGWPIMVRWTIRPGETIELPASNVGLAIDAEAGQKFEHPISRVLAAPPGKYTLRCDVRFGSIQQRDKDGNVTVPGRDDWQGVLVTGNTPFAVRARTPDDDAADREPTFAGRLEFVGPSGRPVENGTIEARELTKRNPLVKTDFAGRQIEVADCPDEPLTITVRAPGYEEAVVYDVKLSPDAVTKIELTPAKPTRLRLVSMIDGGPIAGAKVRFFNKTSGLASAGPFPIDGIQGPVWAASRPDGVVILDTLQRVDPHYSTLGDAVYFFYVEAPKVAPKFIGPVKAGQDLGDIALGPYLEVRGEVQGTPDELEQFAAEWDQPFELATENPAAAWLYAVSQQLETIRAGDKLTFHLTGLRPGRLRIISNFGPHSASHTYGRRDPGKDDSVFETELTKSLNDLVIRRQSKEASATQPLREIDANVATIAARSSESPGAKRSDPQVFVHLMGRNPETNDMLRRVITMDPESGESADFSGTLPHAYGFAMRASPDGGAVAVFRSDSIYRIGADRSLVKLFDVDPNKRWSEPDQTMMISGEPVWSPDGSELMISRGESLKSRHSWKFETWRMNSDGSNPRKLPLRDDEEVHDWSKDGERLATQVYSGTGRDHIEIVKPDGSGRRVLTTRGSWNPRFSPDGRLIVYEDVSDLNRRGLWVRDIEQNKSALIFKWEVNTRLQVAWSPDGKRIALCGLEVPVGQNLVEDRVYVMNADGTDVRVLPTPAGWSPVHVDFARLQAAGAAERKDLRRDGTIEQPVQDLSGRLFVTAGVRTAANPSRFAQLAIAIDPRTGKWTQLQQLPPAGGFSVPLSPTRVSPDGRVALFMREKELWNCDARTGDGAVRVLEKGSPACWSPDGEYFIAVVSKNDSDHQAVENWKMRNDGRRDSVLALPEGDAVEDWSRDGQWLLVSSRKDAQLYIVKPDGSGRKPLTTGGPGDMRNEHPRFSPDGRRIVYVRAEYGGDESAAKVRYSLRVVNPDGSGDRVLLAESGTGPMPDSATWTAPMGARWSPDGKHLAVTLFDHTRTGGVFAINGNWRLAFIDSDGGNLRELKLDGILGLVLPWDGPDWSVAGAADGESKNNPAD